MELLYEVLKSEQHQQQEDPGEGHSDNGYILFSMFSKSISVMDSSSTDLFLVYTMPCNFIGKDVEIRNL